MPGHQVWTLPKSLLWCPFIRKTRLEQFVYYLSCEKTCVFLWATIRPDFTEHFTSTFCIRDWKNFMQKCYIGPAKLLKYVNNCRMRTLMVLKKWEEKCREKHSTTSRVSPYTYFVLEPLPACFVTEQSTVKASLFVKYNATQACSMEKLTDLFNVLTF